MCYSSLVNKQCLLENSDLLEEAQMKSEAEKFIHEFYSERKDIQAIPLQERMETIFSSIE